MDPRGLRAAYDAMVAAAPDGIITIDEESTILLVNRAAEEIFGYASAEMLGKPLTTFMPPALRAAHLASLRQYLETGQRNAVGRPMEFPGFHKSGREISLEISFGEFTANGRRYLTGIIRDVTSRKQAEEERRASLRRVVEAERLRAIAELSAGVAHHLNNALSIILWRIQLLLPQILDPGARRSLEMVERTTQEAAEVIRRLQGFTQPRSQSGATPLDLNELAREILEIIRAIGEVGAPARGIRIQTELAPGAAPAVAGEPTELREMLMSVLFNAVDALPGGGTITVKTWAEDDIVHCSVADTGVGMPDDVRRRAVEPFFTTKGPQTTGLGLSIAYGIVRRLGGDMDIDSAEGRGTTVSIRLPRTAQPESGD